MIFSTTRNLRRAAKTRRGGALMESILVMPLIVMLGFGVIDYSYYFYLKNTLQGAAVAGARAAIPNSATNTTVDNAISTMLNSAGISTASYSVTLNPSNVASASAYSNVTVTVSTTWGAVGTHMLSTSMGGIGNNKAITAVAVMQKEP